MGRLARLDYIRLDTAMFVADVLYHEFKDPAYAPHPLLRRLVAFFFQAEDGIRDLTVTGVQTCALPICPLPRRLASGFGPPTAGLAGGARDGARPRGRAARTRRGGDRPVAGQCAAAGRVGGWGGARRAHGHAAQARPLRRADLSLRRGPRPRPEGRRGGGPDVVLAIGPR